MEHFIPTVAKPWSQDWSQMQPSASGRFCAACAHEVVDFTGMSATQIQEILISGSSNRSCGRFESRQLGHNIIMVPKAILVSQTNFKKSFLLALFVVMGGSLFSCTQEIGEKSALDGVEVSDDGQTIHHTLGAALPPKAIPESGTKITVHRDSITMRERK